MRCIRRAVNELSFSHLIVTILFREMDYAENMVSLVKCEILKPAKRTGLLAADGKSNGNGPYEAVRESHVATDRTVVRDVQKSFQW